MALLRSSFSIVAKDAVVEELATKSCQKIVSIYDMIC